MEVTDVLYKESEIGSIPIDWRLVNVGDYIDINRGGSPRPIQQYITLSLEGINWIKIGDTSVNSKFILSATEKIIKEGLQYSRFVKCGDLLLSNSMSFGRPYILKIDGCIHDGWLVLQNYHEAFDTDYLYYALTSRYVLNQYLQKAAGSSVLNLNKEIVKSVKVLLPPTKSEQTAIATALSDTDALIENLEKLIAKKRNIKQGVMQELLTGRKRLEGFSTEWRYSTLSKFVADKKFAIVDGPFGSQMKVQDFVEQGIPIVEMEHLKNKFLEPDKLDRYITHKKFEELIRSSVFPDDIIISKTGSLGYISIVPSSIEKALITSRLAKITLDKKKANISFVFQCLARLREIEYWQRTAQGGTMLILSIANISHAPIPDISIYEQKEIADILDTMDNDIERLEQILNKYNMIKQGMMQALLTGKIRLV